MTRTPRRRSRRSIGKLVRRFWILAVLLVVFIGWGASRIVALPAFRVTSVAVTGLSAGSHVSRADVIARAAIDTQSNVWLLDRGAIARRIEAIPYVASAHIVVRPPAAVTLDIRERPIDGCVRDGAFHSLTIDADRRVLDDRCDAADALRYDVRTRLDVRPGAYVRDRELIALQDDRRALGPAGDSYRTYSHDPFGELVATLRDGVVVKFGEDDDLDRKERLVGPILAQVGGAGRPIRALDVRAVATPVVEYRPDSVPVKRAKTLSPHAVNKL